jgi:hypothetical protein
MNHSFILLLVYIAGAVRYGINERRSKSKLMMRLVPKTQETQMPFACRTFILFFLLATSIQITSAQTAPSATAQARKIAEIDAETRPADVTARLDAFRAAVTSEPGSRGWLYYYSGVTLPGAALRLKSIAEKYLQLNGNIPLGSSVGGDRTISTIELWLVPQGANRPRPTPMPVTKDYQNAFVWDEMNYFLETERKGLTHKDQQALNSNVFYSQNEWLNSYARALTFPQHPRGLLLIFPKRGDPPDLPSRIAEYQKRYLYRAAGIDESRIAVSTPQALSETRKVQLWLVPGAGAMPMGEFTPTDRLTVSGQLDQLAFTMRSLTGVQSGSKLYIIVYSGACEGIYGKKLLATSLLAEMKQYLLQKQKVLPNEFVLIDGGIMEKCEVEPWLVPPGAITPKPKLREP